MTMTNMFNVLICIFLESPEEFYGLPEDVVALLFDIVHSSAEPLIQRFALAQEAFIAYDDYMLMYCLLSPKGSVSARPRCVCE